VNAEIRRAVNDRFNIGISLKTVRGVSLGRTLKSVKLLAALKVSQAKPRSNPVR